MEKYKTTKSQELHAETKKYLVDGVGSRFQIPSYRDFPITITHGKGSKLYDVDGNEYIDYVLGFGPIFLGHAHPGVTEAVTKQINKGCQFSYPNEDLLTLSKKLTEIIPCAERVMYQSTGTEVVMNALRIARAYTGKYKIVKFEGHYHGWSDEQKITINAEKVEELGSRENPEKIIHTKGQKLSSADELILLPWNDIDALEKTLKERDDIAAVIMEPTMYDAGPIMPKKGYLEKVRQLTKEHGVLLIFDEVITGFRMALGGAQSYYNVVPDMATFAKALTNGYPFGIIAGRKDIMECGVPATGTFSANPVGVAAAIATIEALSEPGLYEGVEKLGNMLVSGLRSITGKYGIKMNAHVRGGLVDVMLGREEDPVDLRDYLQAADVKTYRRFIKGCEEYGIRFMDRGGRIYISAAHTQADIERTLQVAYLVFEEMHHEGVV